VRTRPSRGPAGLSAQPSGSVQLLDMRASLMLQAALRCAATALAAVSARRGWKATLVWARARLPPRPMAAADMQF